LILLYSRIFLWFDKLTTSRSATIIKDMVKGRPRFFRGKILILVLTFLVITGLTHKVSAETSTSPSTELRASSCSSIMVSTPLCDELFTQSCIKTNRKPDTPQIQSSVIVASAKETVSPQIISIQPETQSTPIPTPHVTDPGQQIANLDSDKIFNLINQHRVSLGLAPFELENSVCELAQVRSTELAGELANGTVHSGLYNRNLPYWIWENAKVGSGEEETVAWWLASSLHHQSIVGDYKYSCVKCSGSNCSQLFTSFLPK